MEVIAFPEQEMYAVSATTVDSVSFFRTYMPDIPYRKHETGVWFKVPMTEETYKILDNLAFPMEGKEPLRYRYDIPLVEGQYSPMEHQITTAAFYAQNPRCFNLSTMRTGKTAADVLATEYLMQRGLMSGAQLIVCTVSNLGGVWEDTITSTLPHRKVVRLHGGTGADERREQFREIANYYLINYDGVKMIAHELAQAVTEGRIGGITIDELTHMKNTDSGRWKAMDMVVNGGKHKIGTGKKAKEVCYKPVKYARGLTGTPGSDPENVFGYVRLINPPNMTYTKNSWKMKVKYKWGTQGWQWQLKDDYLDQVEQALQPTIRFNKDHIMDLPPVMKSTLDAPLSPEQQKIYNKLRKDMVMQLESGEQVVASKQSALVSKLLQVASGAVISTDQEVVNLDVSPKLNVLFDLIEATERKVVVFGAFTGVLELIRDAVREKGYTCELVDGSVTGAKREVIFRDFMNRPDPRVIVCHPQTTAFGVELAAADTLVFFGPPLSGDFVYSQAIERASSMKQTAEVINLYHIVSTADEKKIFTAIEKGVSIGSMMNKLYEEIQEDVV